MFLLPEKKAISTATKVPVMLSDSVFEMTYSSAEKGETEKLEVTFWLFSLKLLRP